MSETMSSVDLPATSSDVTLRIGGRLWHCPCGCNVFSKPYAGFPDLYRCNGCGTEFETE
jgi:hypothetical protein